MARVSARALNAFDAVLRVHPGGLEAPAVGDDGPPVVALDDDRRRVGRGDVEPAAGVEGQVLRLEDLRQLRGRPLLGEPSAHAPMLPGGPARGWSGTVGRVTQPPAFDGRALLGQSGPLSRSDAVAALAHAAELMASADFLDAARVYQRVIGFDDRSITTAAMIGLGEALHRLDDDERALGQWEAATELPENEYTYAAWRNVAAAPGAGRRPAGRPRRLPRGRPARAQRGQGRDRHADGLAREGGRRPGRVEALLREGARRGGVLRRRSR